MKVRFLLLFLFCTLFAHAQSNARKFTQIYGGNANEYAYSIRQTLDSGYAIAGSTSSFGNGISDGWLVKTDSVGLVLWAKTYGAGNVDIIRCMRQLPDSGYVMVGYSNSSGHGGYDGWLLRTDKHGDTLWTKHYGTSNWDFFYSFVVTPTQELVIVGATYGQGAGDQDLWIVKTDINGDTIWTRTLGGTRLDEGRGICMLNDSSYAVSGVTHSWGDTLGDAWVIHYDTTGDTLWTATGGEQNHADEAYGIAYLNNFNWLAIAGKTTSAAGDWDLKTQFWSLTGQVTYNISFNYSDDDWLEGIAAKRNNGYACVGTTYTNIGGGDGDFYFFRDMNGWLTTTFGTIRQEEGYAIDTTFDGGFISCGFSKGMGATSTEVLPNMYIVKVDTTGYSTTVLGVHQIDNAVSSLATAAFPNPTSDDVTIGIKGELPALTATSIRIYDLTGRLVLDEEHPDWNRMAINYAQVNLNLAALPQGTYFYQVMNSNQVLSAGKVMLSR